MEEEKARDLQLKVMEVFEKEHIEQLHVYVILNDLVDILKKYFKKEEDLDIDKLIKSSHNTPYTNLKENDN